MATATVQISEASQRILEQLSEQTGQSMAEIFEKALDAYRRQVFFEGLQADYAALRSDPKAWADYQAEHKLWDATLMDGLDPNERWTEDGQCLSPDPPPKESA